MTPEERTDLANRILADLTVSMTSDQRKAVAAQLTDTVQPAVQE